MTEPVPKLFLQTLAALTNWLESTRAQAMVIGGVAASILGRPRATRDIDALAILPEDQWASALASAPKYGIVARISAPLDFARRTRVLLLRHEESGIDIDVILGRLPFEEEAISRGTWHDLGGIRVKLPQVEDLLILKAIAHRPHDLRDIDGLLDVHPGANVELVRQWVREFATAMAMPELLTGFDQLLEQRKAKSKG